MPPAKRLTDEAGFDATTNLGVRSSRYLGIEVDALTRAGHVIGPARKALA